jgi:hypothetical protein
MALTLFAFRPRRATIQPAGEWGLGVQAAWSSIEEIRRFPSWAPSERVVFDCETIRSTLRGRYGLGSGLDFEIELPLVYASAGRLDSFIEAWHDFLSLPKGGRERFPDDRFEVRMTEGGDELYALEDNRLGLQDIPLILTRELRSEDAHGPALAVRAAVELPTGSQRRGFGNGAPDFGLGLVGERSWGRVTATFGLDLHFPGQPDRLEALQRHKLDDGFALELGAEYRWNDNCSMLVGTVWTSRMISSMELEEINREVFDLGLGVAWDLSPTSRVSVSVHEDIVAATGSDLSLQLGWSAGF